VGKITEIAKLRTLAEQVSEVYDNDLGFVGISPLRGQPRVHLTPKRFSELFESDYSERDRNTVEYPIERYHIKDGVTFFCIPEV
jgi:hypothetical protein